MEAIRKQAARLREQVAKQQQAVFKQFGAGGYGDSLVTDEVELRQHQKLEKLYISTRSSKHFQRDIVRGVEGYLVIGTKQVDIGIKLAEDIKKYGAADTCTSGDTLTKAALSYGHARSEIEKQRGNLLKALATQVAEPLRAMVTASPLEDARHIAQRYDRMRQEAEAQAIEVSKRQFRVKETPGNSENIMKLEASEAKLQELKVNMAKLGNEAVASMAAVEAQQQRLTLQRLISMVEAERTYHQRVLQILDQVEDQIVTERQRIEGAYSENSTTVLPDEDISGIHHPSMNAANGLCEKVSYFLGEVIHPHEAESDVELNLSVGDFVVVRKVSDNGWAEGECKGRSGWFPYGFVQRRDRLLASKVAEVF